ncbi:MULTISPECIES: hypothetical protein [Streptomyces]|uniref:hypothetical protein n=1 Tax=Streptomyces TaxID=1883 RepID=UPI001316052D|nr:MULTISPECIES: hypothetical protein [Streptomyces]QGZ48696.1 hypothetical protein GPZ77_10160 [Streptomyces sp. QHH-9511]GGT63145.1 hypothetical protein GCM10010272_01500 [Streptomyces lateritius]
MTTTRRGVDSDSLRPQIELRWGGLHVTVQHVPAWFVALITTAGGVAGTWWAQR